MARMGRPGMSDEQKRELWDRWANGESISQIARALARPPGSGFTVLKVNGGYVPLVRRRRPETLTGRRPRGGVRALRSDRTRQGQGAVRGSGRTSRQECRGS